MRFINFLKLFFKGEASLTNSFFVIGIGLNIIVVILFFVIMSGLDSVATNLPILGEIFLKFYLFLSAWFLFLAIGFFRTANNIWKYSTKEDSGKAGKTLKNIFLYIIFQLSVLQFIFYAFLIGGIAFKLLA